MDILAVLSPLSIYNGWSTRMTFWEVKLTLNEFKPVNMKTFGCRNVRKHIKIKDSDKYTTLGISLKFGSLENMRITFSEPKDYLGWLEKGLITSLGLKTNVRSKKYKKSRYAINNVSMKDISKIINEFENFTL